MRGAAEFWGFMAAVIAFGAVITGVAVGFVYASLGLTGSPVPGGVAYLLIVCGFVTALVWTP
jgi:hypothetical protein